MNAQIETTIAPAPEVAAKEPKAPSKTLAAANEKIFQFNYLILKDLVESGVIGQQDMDASMQKIKFFETDAVAQNAYFKEKLNPKSEEGKALAADLKKYRKEVGSELYPAEYAKKPRKQADPNAPKKPRKTKADKQADALTAAMEEAAATASTADINPDEVFAEADAADAEDVTEDETVTVEEVVLEEFDYKGQTLYCVGDLVYVDDSEGADHVAKCKKDAEGNVKVVYIEVDGYWVDYVDMTVFDTEGKAAEGVKFEGGKVTKVEEKKAKAPAKPRANKKTASV